MFEILNTIQSTLNSLVWGSGIPLGGQTIPFMVILLLGTGIFVTFRLFMVQIRWFKHGIDVIRGKFDDPEHAGDINHFQALTTALSATVGIGNIAGVALAIHYGGPGAIFWMWITAFFGMALKYVECTLAMTYRVFDKEGNASGGPMYYIEKGLGPKFKWMAIFFAVCAIISSFGSGNTIQSFTVADSFKTDFGIAPWITGIFVTFIVGIVIIGGIRRIGAVTSKLAPLMAAMYCLAALVILLLNLDKIPGILQMIVAQAFNPVAGVTGVAGGGFLVTLLWGVKRGLFSNEAGQGSAPIAHAAAKTDEPVREGVVAMLGPFIDTLVICTMTGLVILISGASHTFIPTTLKLTDTNISWVTLNEQGLSAKVEEKVAEIQVAKGLPVTSGSIQLAYYDIAVKQLFLDQAQKLPFTGKLLPEKNQAIDVDGKVVTVLYGDACRNSAPLTSLGFTLGLAPLGLGWLGGLIVTLSVFLFAVSTAISWSYYGDRCVQYLFGVKYVPHYKWVYLVVNYLGAIISLEMVWGFGDAALGLMAIPNLIAIILLYRKTHELTVDYEVRVMKPLKNA